MMNQNKQGYKESSFLIDLCQKCCYDLDNLIMLNLSEDLFEIKEFIFSNK